jgi:pyruvate/2-oxoglutarate dehydrogenase complex dihydrolipoamide dehydrogenase (E3) component
MSPGIWAIGDITAPPWLAHKASHEGVIAAEAIAQALGNKDVHPHAMDVRNIPGCTYCHPQVASVGLTEAKAKEAGYEVKVGRSRSSATARPSRWARQRASSRPCSTPRPANCSART